MWASASATVAVGGQDHRLGGHHAARGVVGVGEQPPHRRGLLGLHQREQLARPARRAGRAAGRRRRRGPSPPARRRRAPASSVPRMAIWSPGGSSSRTSASRSSSRARGDLDAAACPAGRAGRWPGRRRASTRRRRSARRRPGPSAGRRTPSPRPSRRSACSRLRARRPVDGDLGDLPVDGLGLAPSPRRRRSPARRRTLHGQVEHLADDQRLGGALLEPAHVDAAR